MKKKVYIIAMSCIMSMTLVACELPFSLPFGKKADAEDEMTVEDEQVVSDEGMSDEPVVKEEAPVVTYEDSVASLDDPYSGFFAIGNIVIHYGVLYPSLAADFNSIGYKLISAEVDSSQMVEALDEEMVPEEGVFTAVFAPDGIVNVMDPKAISCEFAVPWNRAANVSHKNVNLLRIGEFKLQSIRFSIYDSAGSFTGNSLTVPGYMQAVLTKVDMVSALGGNTGDYLVADMSTAVKFYKEDTCLSDITSKYNSESNLTDVEIVYDVNYDVDVSRLKPSTDLSDIDYDISAFSGFIDFNIEEGQYYGFCHDKNKAMHIIVANAENVDPDTYCVYEGSVYSRGEDGDVYFYADLASSAVDMMPIKFNGSDTIYCAAVGQVAAFSVNKTDGVLDVKGIATKFLDDNGKVMYNYGDSENSESGDRYEELKAQYDTASTIVMYKK